MNEDSMAGSLFFALLSIAVLFKLDEITEITGIGLGVGVICAIISAFFLKKSIMQAAIAEEENHQRLEIQFQQLRHKLGDGDGSSEETVRAIVNGSNRIEEELQVIRDKLVFLESLTQIAESSAETKTAFQESLKSIDENIKSPQELIKTLANNSEAETKLVKITVEKMSAIEEKLSSLEEISKKLNETSESSQTTVQTGLKLLQVIGQMLKAPAFAKDLTQLGKTMETFNEKLDKLESLDKLEALDKLETLEKLEKLDTLQQLEALEEIKTNMIEVSEKLSNLSKLSDAVSDSGQSMTTSVDQLSEVNRGINEETSRVSENVINLTSGVEKSSLSIIKAIKSMQEDISKLTTKIDAYNGLMKTSLEQYSTLTEQDVKVLEKIAEKIQ